jgi:acetyl/propionyl-CoA carboxylase alpha subunit
MGIETIAVHSEADEGALHARVADRSVLIGPGPSAESYLRGDRIIDAARSAGADAVHPGYGFLSQNGDFADAVAAAGLVFIGPPGDVHRRMGDKAGARRLMIEHGVPVIPGYDGDDQGDARLLAEARRVGFPLIVKPSRGGGGKGMRIVRREAEVLKAVESARREAASSFGSDVLVLERFVERPRHVEVQVLFDSRGQGVHLFERECSVQRRHQKVFEESPSPALEDALRERLCEAGLRAARAAAYVNAGTVEFLLAPSGEFFFLEMNTRLQVEHPVTEMTLGLDLVRLQIDVASGAPLPVSAAGLKPRGWAIEARVNAEDPLQGDAPSPGNIVHFEAPQGPFVRCDLGVATGSVVPPFYDPMIAKIIATGATRIDAIANLDVALRDTVVFGVATNRDRLLQILRSDCFRAGDIHTRLLDDPESEGGLPPLPLSAGDASLTSSDHDAALIAAFVAAEATPSSGEARSRGTRRPENPSPWFQGTAFRI